MHLIRGTTFLTRCFYPFLVKNGTEKQHPLAKFLERRNSPPPPKELLYFLILLAN